jgi:hypothetical protein
MIHYFIIWFEYNNHHENTWARITWKGQNTKGAARILVLTVGCHPRYMLPTHITRNRRIYKSSTFEEGAGSSAGVAGAGAC